MHHNIHCKHITGYLRTTCGHPDRPKALWLWRHNCEMCLEAFTGAKCEAYEERFKRPPDPAPMNPAYLVADHSVKEVNAVYVNGEPVDWRRIAREYIIPEIQKTTGRGGAEQ